MNQLEWKDASLKTANSSQFWVALASATAAILIGLIIGFAISRINF